MSDRRNFLKKSSAIGFAPFFGLPFINENDHLSELIHSKEHMAPEILAEDETYWRQIRESFTVNPNLINLNNAAVCPQSRLVQEAQASYLRQSNEGPSYYMWRVLGKGRESVREKLALMLACDPEEIAFNRNATEGLDTIIFGIDLEPEDEVILSKYDYPSVINAWRQREKRDGIRLVFVDLSFPMEDDDEIANRFKKAFSPKSKVVNITHMINWSGQILPVRKIADAAHKEGIEVIVDGAQTFAHIPFTLNDLGADYFAASCHKWLCAPFGTGFMHVRKDRIKNLWPLIPDHRFEGDDIRKLESLGTRSFPAELSISQALDFHEKIGPYKKCARLFYLKNYWAEKIAEHSAFQLNTSLLKDYSAGIGHITILNKDPYDVERQLMNQFRIHCVTMNWEKLSGLRIPPNIYTLVSDLDQLIKALKKIVDK